MDDKPQIRHLREFRGHFLQQNFYIKGRLNRFFSMFSAEKHKNFDQKKIKNKKFTTQNPA